MRDFMAERNMQLSNEIVEKANKLFDVVAEKMATTSSMHVQGAVIAELMAVWLGGMPPRTRANMLKILVDSAINLVPLHEGWKEQR
jgi:hypothetical protein